MFDVNLTLAIQFVNFVVTLVVLDYLLIRPIRGIIKKRRDLASGMLSDAAAFTEGAACKLENYEAALARAREEAAALRDKRREEGAAREAGILEAAHSEAREFLHSSRESTEAAVAQTRAAMEKRVPEFADMAVASLLGKSRRSSAVQG